MNTKWIEELLSNLPKAEPMNEADRLRFQQFIEELTNDSTS